MAQLGGWGQLGGTFQLGGSVARGQLYYGILKALGPPGLRPSDNDATTNRVLRAVAMGLGHGDIHVNRREAEMFPLTAVELLPEWESFLRVVPLEGATIAERQAAVYGRWRGLQAPSLPILRKLFYSVLQPATAFRDTFPGSGISGTQPLWRYTHLGEGTNGVDGAGALEMAIDAGTDGSLGSDAANMLLYRLHDIDDGWTWQAKILSRTIGADTLAGAIVFSDLDNYAYVAYTSTPNLSAVADFETRGSLSVASVADPGAPQWMRIQRDKTTGALTFSHSADGSSWTTITSYAAPFPPLRYVGLFCANDVVSTNAVALTADEVKLVHETPENNVEIVETIKAARDAEDAAELVFMTFVHRTPDDSGSYNIKAAQQLADSRKHAHKLMLVGEETQLRFDEVTSLMDRDILGE